MSEDDVLYSEVKFTRRRGNTDRMASSPATSEVRILSTEPPSELPVHTPPAQQLLASNSRSKVTPERAAFVLLGVLVAAAVIALGLTSYKTMGHLQKLTDEVDALGRNLREILQNLTDKLEGQGNKVTDDSRPECEEGWKQHGAECYYFSTNKSTWGESSRACSCRGGTLVRIGSREEQEYLEGELRRNHARGKFWIGLTDLKKEGTWLWTDVSPLDPSLAFWKPYEPDDWKGNNLEYPDGEDCAAMEGNRAVDLKCWFDQLCSVTHGHICDKPAQTSRSKCV
ncbi:immune-related, lectin-like receptor 4 [Cyclopterus lumpus]|uniref:immune-related, lectin-like receptor 4 n=1 Tax=Cyclopterus lumpus TaxID=8103 RepID=UPI001485EADD|nr:immune-related, lectin-like receptor 4 [Cyclopterus lumpus]